MPSGRGLARRWIRVVFERMGGSLAGTRCNVYVATEYSRSINPLVTATHVVVSKATINITWNLFVVLCMRLRIE